MTDKEQIIIDGVDVSECEYLTNELEEDGEYYWFCNIAPAGGPDECECNPECIYKRVLRQLARKTQEYNELLEQHKELDDRANRLIGEKYNLGRECEELEKQLETSEEWRIKAESLNEKLELRNTCYRKALEEIEGMLQVIVESNKVYPLRSNLYKILDIIRKAKGGEDKQ